MFINTKLFSWPCFCATTLPGKLVFVPPHFQTTVFMCHNAQGIHNKRITMPPSTWHILQPYLCGPMQIAQYAAMFSCHNETATFRPACIRATMHSWHNKIDSFWNYFYVHQCIWHNMAPCLRATTQLLQLNTMPM